MHECTLVPTFQNKFLKQGFTLSNSQPQLTIAKKMAACRFYCDPLRAKISFSISYEKFDL